MENVTQSLNINLLKNSPIKELIVEDQIKVKYSFNDKIIFLNITKNEITLKEYELLLSLENLYKINKFFLNFESTMDLVDWIINSIQ